MESATRAHRNPLNAPLRVSRKSPVQTPGEFCAVNALYGPPQQRPHSTTHRNLGTIWRRVTYREFFGTAWLWTSLVRTGLGPDFPVEQGRRRVPKTAKLRILFHPERSLNALPVSTKFLLTSPLMLILQRGRLVSRNPAFRSLATEGNPPPECRVVWRVLPRRLLCTIPVIHQRWRLFQL